MASPNPSGHNTELSVDEDCAICESTTTLASTSLDLLSTLLDAMPKITQTDHFARLPNELIESILKRFEVPNLIPLRLVNPRWNVIIESMCHKKKSLALVSRHFAVKLKDRFDGKLDLSRLVTLKLKEIDTNSNFESTVGDLCALLSKLFPSIEQLFVNRITVPEKSDFLIRIFSLWSTSLVTLYFDGKILIDAQNVPQICTQLNAMTNLKNLDISNENIPSLKSLASTLERLHHLSFGLFESPKVSWYELVDNLGPHCTSLRVDMHIRDETDGSDWPIRIAQSPITHLQLNAFVGNFENFFYNVFPGQFADTLKSLHITDHLARINLITSCTINPVMSHLTQLSDIRFDGPTHFIVGVYSFRDALIPMPNVRNLSFGNFELFCPVTNAEELFCRFFSTIFPNLERLALHCHDPRFVGKVRLFLNLFKALRYHDISYVE